MPNKAFIPLYINQDMLNNLFTIVIQEFVEIKSISTKDAVVVHLETPMSEFSYDIFGKYVQGNFEVTFQNESIKQRTEEKISTTIVVLKKLKDILSNQGLLKEIDTLDDLSLIQGNDFIEFTTQLQPNPVLNKVNSIIEGYEIEQMLSDDEQLNSNQMISFLKQEFNNCKDSKCQRFIANPTAHNSSVIIVPVKKCCMLDYEDYMITNKVSIMGKVVKKFSIANDLETAVSSVNKDNYLLNLRRQLLSNTLLDNIDFNNVIQKISAQRPGINSRVMSNDMSIENLDNMIEIVPIAIVL
jgi:hypothetical protein